MISEFGLREGINEVIGITLGEWINTAPLGIIVGDDVRVRLYGNHTRRFLERTGVLYVNVIHDPVVFVISAFEDLGEEWFESLNPPVIRGSESWLKFSARVEGNYAILDFAEGEVLRSDLRAINRGFNMLIEATVHATRYVLSGSEALAERIRYCGRIIERCGGRREKEAYELLLGYAGLKKEEG
ncbi:hypothetical protein GAH_00302 [Geoglobus ahangari]|uniref:DUF447 family protein n=1 Tax=Geoglobus ahangari TaxID=113653 RepID=A0A0F7IJC5_9EURY|nr:hypothetical protein GAH_00302 [Geoglobus ahangari]